MKDEFVIALIFAGVFASTLLPVFFSGQTLAFLFANIAMTAFLTQLRHIRDKPTRAFLIIVAGLSSFWLTGASLVQSDISIDSWPLFVFAVSSAQTVLLAYTLSVSEGITFGATAFALVIGAFNFGRAPLPIFTLPIDKLLIIAVLSSISEAAWAWLVGNTDGIKDAFFAIGKASIIASALNFFSFYVQYAAVATTTHVTWFYFLSHTVIISILILLHEFVTNTYNVRRELTEAGAKYRAKLAVEEVITEDEASSDPYKDLIDELRAFEKSPPKNKLVATQTLARFKKEFRVLSSRYDTRSKKVAEKLLTKLGG